VKRVSTELHVAHRRLFHGEVSFAKTDAAMLPVTIATSRELIALVITMIGRPERSDGTCVRAHVSNSDAHGAADDLRQRVVRNDGVSRRLLGLRSRRPR